MKLPSGLIAELVGGLRAQAGVDYPIRVLGTEQIGTLDEPL
jgi:hypothetical protein